MKTEQAIADVELRYIRYRGKVARIKALVDSGASKGVILKGLSDELGAFTPLEKPYELRTADKEGKLRIIGFCNVDVSFQGVEVPGEARFERQKTRGKV